MGIVSGRGQLSGGFVGPKGTVPWRGPLRSASKVVPRERVSGGGHSGIGIWMRASVSSFPSTLSVSLGTQIAESSL